MAGEIEACPKNGCDFHCCDFNQNNFIVLLPNELDYINEMKTSHKHLEIIEAKSDNSHKAICRAKDRKNCDGGYKPIDCQIYPLFPSANDEFYLKGKKCPLDKMDLKEHRVNTEKILSEINFCDNKKYRDWLSTVELTGYEKINKKDNAPQQKI